MAEKLKICPFCGGDAELWTNTSSYGRFVYVKCSVCDAQTRIKTAHGDPECDPDFWEQSGATQAVRLWNTRAGKEGNNEQND